MILMLAFLTSVLALESAGANWESTWRVGDTWAYRVQSVEVPGPYTQLPYHDDYTLAMAVVEGARRDPWRLGAQLWVWTLLVEHDRYGFPVSAHETVYVHEMEGVDVVRWPLPTLFLWFDASQRPEEGAARVGIRREETEPAVWEWRMPIESAGEAVGEVIYRVTLESIGPGTLEAAGGLMKATGLQYRAETRTEWVGRKPTLRIHKGTAWGSDDVGNWVTIEGQEEVDGRVVREYRLDLVSFSRGATTGWNIPDSDTTRCEDDANTVSAVPPG
ncbi:MAG: hypothetical protein BIP78_0789 [Candidatus Bipolaricaulis sibiricus]|uniref:Uncharacterized protein n=1 Tax=Bipolaricaulis sibiricus TaxID=2501609 RepID=A0A410FTX8_BIPS1|nr:MAG: hypothetical protein BIP78_0789 [Candidatus Bipolaricaulis sibiricus]